MNVGKNGMVEPSAATREGANALRQMFVALVDQGFTEPQALQIVGVAVAAAMGNAE